MLNEVLKICEKIICVDVRANSKQQETKELVDVFYQSLQEVYTLK